MPAASIKWSVDRKTLDALLGTYRGRQLRMTAENRYYIVKFGEREVARALSKGECYKQIYLYF